MQRVALCNVMRRIPSALIRLLIFLLSVQGMVFGQQLPQFTQFREVQSLTNPASVGVFGALSFGFAGRHQWMGLRDHAGRDIGPCTYLAHAGIPLTRINSGIGMVTVHDQVAHEQTLLVRMNAAHHIHAGKQGVISIGASFDYLYKAFNQDNNSSGMGYLTGIFQNERGNAFDVGAGIMYSHEGGTYFGLSAHNLLEATLGYSYFNYHYRPQFHLMAGTIYSVYESRLFNLDLLPGLLIHFTDALKPQYTATMLAMFNHRFYTGAAYRHQDAVGGVAGVVIKEHLRIGLSYDYTISELRAQGSAGSPELTITYIHELGRKPKWKDFCY